MKMPQLDLLERFVNLGAVKIKPTEQNKDVQGDHRHIEAGERSSRTISQRSKQCTMPA